MKINSLIGKTKTILIFIFLLSFALRIIRSNYPPLLWDEASLGYNAYSILKTARDEYGTFLPIIFKSFGDYKPGLYIYLSLPFVALFGLTPLAVRLPSILAGSFMPILLFFLISKFQKTKNKSLPLISALLLAIAPQAIHFSRGAWETNILTFQLLLGSFFFFLFKTKRKNLFLLLSSLTFAASLYTYQGAKLTTLLVIIALIVSFYPSLRSLKKALFDKNLLLYFVLPLALFAFPYVFSLLTTQSGDRLKVTSLFSYPRPEPEIQAIISESDNLNYSLFHSQSVFFVRNVASRYFSHFSPTYLLFEGDWSNPRHSAPYIGIILYPSIIFLILGFLKTISKIRSFRATDPLFVFMLLWLIFSPLPAALSRDSIHAVRSMSQIIPLTFFTAYGLSYVLKAFRFLKNPLIVLYFLSLVLYLDLYHNHMVRKSPKDFLYGHREVSTYLAQNIHRFDQVIFSDFFGQPYIYYLFWSQYPPARYQSQASLSRARGPDIGKVEKLDQIHFRSINWETDSKKENTLLVIAHDEVLRLGLDRNEEIFKKLTPISPLGNLSTFYIYETNNFSDYAQKE